MMHIGIATAHAATAVAHFTMDAMQWVISIAQDAAADIIAAVGWAVQIEQAMGGIIAKVFSQGGIVPSAAGGMVLGGGGQLAILHPREMVLPANLSEGIQGAIN